MVALFLVMSRGLWIYMLSSINVYVLDPCLLADGHIARSACLRRTFGSATGNAHACMPISFTPAAAPRVLSGSCLCLSHTGKVQRPCSTRETSIHQCHHRTQLVGSRGYIFDPNGQATEDWQSQSNRLMLSCRAMAAFVCRCVEHRYPLTSITMRSRLQA